MRISRAFVASLLCSSAVAVDELVDLGYRKVQGLSNPLGATQWLGVRYAAPPLGDLRFSAPQPPPSSEEVEDATKYKAICLPTRATDNTANATAYFFSEEDCLYLNIFAPSKATAESKLPVLYYIQGGGFGVLSKANNNASSVVAEHDFVFVQVNYRVGPYGFLYGNEVKEGGNSNNGLRDQLAGLDWVKEHITNFGGDPDHIVVSGESAGGTSQMIHFASWGEKGEAPIKGAIIQSASLPSPKTLEESQSQYACLLNSTGCGNTYDSLACLRGLDGRDLWTESCSFSPAYDDDIISHKMTENWAEGRYLKIPTLMGTCDDEGTTIVDKSVDTIDAALSWINNDLFGQLSTVANETLIDEYLNISRPVFPDRGKYMIQLGEVWAQYAMHCVAYALQNVMVGDGLQTWNYHYNLIDDAREASGDGAYHASDAEAFFGWNNTRNAGPKSLETTNKPLTPIIRGYYTSFVKTLDPNTLRAEETPEWKQWTGPEARERILLQTNNTKMETMSEAQQKSCIQLLAATKQLEGKGPDGYEVIIEPSD